MSLVEKDEGKMRRTRKYRRERRRQRRHVFLSLMIPLTVMFLFFMVGHKIADEGKTQLAMGKGEIVEHDTKEIKKQDPPKSMVQEAKEYPKQPEPVAFPEKLAYLTFDDGPTEATEELLDLLKKHNVKATFFMLDGNMREYPHLVKRMKNEGHGLGLHGVSHDRKKFYRSKQSVLAELNQAKATAEEIIGEKPSLIRTPYGSYPGMKPSYKEAVAEEGYKLWDWNVDSKDWKYRNHYMIETTIAQVEELEEKNEAPVILMHDRPKTVQYVEELIVYLIDKGYKLEPLSEKMEPIVF